MSIRWGIIGFGEVGSAFAKHLQAKSTVPVRVTDPMLNAADMPDNIRQRLAGVVVEIDPDIPTLVKNSDIIFSMVVPTRAAAAAEAAAKCWGGGLFIDYNSIAPTDKRQLAARFVSQGYVDGAILGSIAGTGAKTPLALAGPRAAEAHLALQKVELNTTVVGDEVGAASALKMCRSVFMKGIECLLVETLQPASRFGITAQVLDSIEDTFDSYGFRPMVEMLVTTHAAHCGRRADEMAGVGALLGQMKLPHYMTSAAQELLAASDRAGLPQHFNGMVPNNKEEVISYLLKKAEE